MSSELSPTFHTGWVGSPPWLAYLCLSSSLPPLSSPGPTPSPTCWDDRPDWGLNDQALSAWVLQVQPLSHSPLVQKTHSHGLLNELFWISDPLFSVRSVSPTTSISHITLLQIFVTIRMPHPSDSLVWKSRGCLFCSWNIPGAHPLLVYSV